MSENQLKIIQIQKQEECDKDIDSDIQDDENDEGKLDNFEGYNGSGRTVTLQMLLSANVLQPGKSAMTIEYLGQKFVGDLLPDGKIKSQETETVFLSPSAWAMHCKRIINPEKKSGCGWASVKYKGKKLDAYKASWMRKCAQQKDVNQDYDETYADLEKKNDQESPVIKRTILPHNSISNRNVMHDANTLVETVPFLSINKMQPFLVTISSNALLLAEFHSHLTFQEVCGYFGGTWDVNTHSLIIVKTYPCKNTKYDREKAPEREIQIQQQITKDQLVVVGWYHSHPKFQSQPTLRDCDTQLDYQIKMRGPSDLTYTPCVGLIFAPYYEEEDEFQSPNTAFWVIPPAENRQIMEYGRPMLMQYDIISDNKINDDVKQEMESCVSYYTKFRNELIDFSGLYRDDITFIEKLKYTLYSKFPQNKNDPEFWNWLSRLLKCKESDNLSILARTFDNKDFKNPVKKDNKVGDHLTESLDGDLKSTTPELKILSLQEQLCLPSGLNMNPSKLCPPLPTQNVSVTNNPILSSPSDSPITIPSSSASPAKFEVPVRASPSPAKSDSSSTRTRNSPAPSPGKFNISDMSIRNSPSVTPNKFDHNIIAAFNIQNTETANSDLMASNVVASLAGQIPNVLPCELSVLFQKEYGSSSLKQLAETAAKVGGGSTSIGTKDLFDKRNNEFSFSILSTGAAQKTPDHLKGITKSNNDSHKCLKSPSANSSYKTKLMKELEDLKNDPLKISELMRSPEYAALLLQQAEALGATTLGTLGFGSDFPFLGSATNMKNKNNVPDYSNMLHSSKNLGYDFTQQSKNQTDLNQLFQQHIGNSAIPSSSKKYQKQIKQTDYTTLLQTYSKYFDSENFYNPSKGGSSLGSHELSALLHSSLSGNLGNNKALESNSEVLNNFLQSEKNLTELNNLLFHQNKNVTDFSSLFASSVSNTLTTPSLKTLPGETSTYYSQTKPEKIQDFSTVYQQNHGKLSIPDPLSKSTLAANNMFMSPSTLLKLHQESLMMKPPKSSPGIVPKIRESHINITPTSLPSHERLTPTKSFRDNTQISGPKYNFSAADLAVSSVQNNHSQSPSPINNCPSKTPPVDLSRIYAVEQPRKRMEFSSIADLAAPPPVKVTKLNEREGILNLSSNE